MDQCEPSRFVMRVQHAHELREPVWRHVRADLDSNGIADTARVLDVRAIELGCAHADPRQVCRKIVPA